MSEPTASSTPRDADEAAELARLRAEVNSLRERETQPRERKPFPWRSIGSAVCIVLACVLSLVTVVAVWVGNQVSNTDRFVANVSPLVHDPAVQTAITDRVTQEIFTYVDVQRLADQALVALQDRGVPAPLVNRLQGFTPALANGVHGFVHDRVSDVVTSPQFADTFNQAVRIAHQQANAVLSGNASAISTQNGNVNLDLGVFIAQAKQRMEAAGFAPARLIPDLHPTVRIADASALENAQTMYKLLDVLSTWLPWITLILFAVGIFLARKRRRALLRSGLGLALAMLVLAVTLAVVRLIVVNSVSQAAVAPTGASYDILVRFLRAGLRTVLVVGLVVAVGAYLTGPSPSAVRLRGYVTELAGKIRSGSRGGPVAEWVHTYRRPLQIGALAVFVLIFVFLDRPSGLTVLLLAILLLIVLGVIELIQRPAETPRTRPGKPGTHEPQM